MKLQKDIVIARPVEEVFEYWADLERASEWAAPVVERRKLTDGPVGAGTRFLARDRFPGRVMEFELEITGYEPNRYMSADWYEPMTGGWEAWFAEEGDATRLTMSAEMNATGPMRFVFPLLGPWAKRAMGKDLERFKSRLEDGRD